jgi:hypothetical protein
MSLSELRAPFLNGAQRSVNRKVQGSNPCPGANCKFEIGLLADAGSSLAGPYRELTALDCGKRAAPTWTSRASP